MKKGDLIFVYGTLRVGESADLSRNQDATFLQQDKINGVIYDLGWYPGVKVAGDPFTDADPLVVGDVFILGSNDVTKTLDNYECYPSLYNRIVVQTQSGLSVWVYTYNGGVDRTQRIMNGDYVLRAESPPVVIPMMVPQ